MSSMQFVCHFSTIFLQTSLTMIEENGHRKKCVASTLYLFVCSFFCKSFVKNIYESHSEDNKKVEWLKGKRVCVRVCV